MWPEFLPEEAVNVFSQSQLGTILGLNSQLLSFSHTLIILYCYSVLLTGLIHFSRVSEVHYVDYQPCSITSIWFSGIKCVLVLSMLQLLLVEVRRGRSRFKGYIKLLLLIA